MANLATRQFRNLPVMVNHDGALAAQASVETTPCYVATELRSMLGGCILLGQMLCGALEIELGLIAR